MAFSVRGGEYGAGEFDGDGAVYGFGRAASKPQLLSVDTEHD